MTLPQIEMVPLNKIKDNPWRDKKRNPISPEKVKQIAESIVSTKEFWIGVYGRKVTGGFVELAFGHHRADAAKAVDTGDVIEAAKHAGLKSIPVAIREFTDGEMLMRMTRENLRGELPVVLEAVSAAVRALAEGKIEVPAPDVSTRKDALRYAPSFVPGKEPSDSTVLSRPYTADTLARFLGGIYTAQGIRGEEVASNPVRAALGILELEERKIAKPEQFYGMPVRKIIPATSDIKKRVEVQQTRIGKTAEQITKQNAEKAEKDRQARELQKQADKAKEAERIAAAKAKLDKENKEKAEALRIASEERDRIEAEQKELAKDTVQLVKEQRKTAKQLELEQAKLEYAPVLSAVQSTIFAINSIGENGGSLENSVKALGKNKLITMADRSRVWEALQHAEERFENLQTLIRREGKL